MSYKSKKIKKSNISYLKYKIGKIKIAFRKVSKVLLQFRSKGERNMFLPQTRKIMGGLRDRARITRTNNKSIDMWVDNYINDCLLNGKPITILTQWCLTKNLKQRYEVQGQNFQPLPVEKDIFEKYIPQVAKLLRDNGASFEWYITFNDAYVDALRVPRVLADAYISVIRDLYEQLPEWIRSNIVMLHWEQEVLRERPGPNITVEADFWKYVDPAAFSFEVDSAIRNAKRFDATFSKSRETIEAERRDEILCEIEEGQYLMGEESLFLNGQFILIPLEFSERYDWFEVLAPSFKKRIASVFPLYPWRLH